MVRTNAPTKKKQKQKQKQQPKRGGIDFKKIKRKIGRKLAPPKNATNTEIKSKAIILPEQSVVSEKAGLAVSKKGLTLKELLQQTSHHNSKVRKDALTGIKDIFLNHPGELKLHKLAAIEKLRERIGDEDKFVREGLYQLFKTVIFPGCKEDHQGPFVSLMMAYIFNGMTHLSIDVRLMAFKFFDLVVQYYPLSFSLYAEKILNNYEEILRKNQFYLQDKGKLKNALAGLARCLLLLPCKKQEDDSSSFKNGAASGGVLHGFESDAPKNATGLSVLINKLKDLLPILVDCFHDFVPLMYGMQQIDAQSFDCMLCILQSIDLIFKFFMHVTMKNQAMSQTLLVYGEKSDVIVWDQSIWSVSFKKLWDVFPLNTGHHHSEKDDERYFILNVTIAEIFLRLSELACPEVALMEKFLEFVKSLLSEKIFIGLHSGKTYEKNLLRLIPFIPKLIMRVAGSWKSLILEAFTNVFKKSNPESSLMLACLSVVDKMLVSEQNMLYPETNDPHLVDYQITWIRELPSLLIKLGDKHPLTTKAVLQLQLRLGQHAQSNSPFSHEYDNMQYSLKEFYCTLVNDGSKCYGPFVMLTRDIQELALCCLYYFSFLDSLLLQSLASCCLCHDLEPCSLFRMVEILHSAYKAGHIQMADHISFLITLLSRSNIFPEKINPMLENAGKSKRGTFKSITAVICSCLLQIGDDYLVFQMIEKVVLDQILVKPPLDNFCALLRMLITLDSRPTRLAEQSIICLSYALAAYLVDVVSYATTDESGRIKFIHGRESRYYLVPCFFLFYRSEKLLNLVLHELGLLITQNSSTLSQHSTQSPTDHIRRIRAIVSVLLLMYKDARIRRILLSCKEETDCILQNIVRIQFSEEIKMTPGERHTIQTSLDQLKVDMNM